MAEYISKSALVAEIEKLYNGEIDTYTRNILDRLKSNIDTLEVKDVDLEKEIIRYRMNNPIIEHREESLHDYMTNVAKHFFELGHSVNNKAEKEVDLDIEVTHYLLYEHRSPLNEIMHKADLKLEMQYHKDIENAFKAGFELGRTVSNKAQKGEEV